MPKTPVPQRSPLPRRLLSWLVGTIGVLAILLAVALGIFRLLIGQIPEYQTELKAWVAEELGLSVDFAVLDARLGLTGPELSLRGASIGDGDGGEFLLADQAALTLDPFALIFGRRIEISRLTLAGVHLTIERDAAGTFRLGERAIEPGVGRLSEALPQSVQIRIRDSVLRYIDRVRDGDWEFDDLDLVVESNDGRMTARASVQPPDELSQRIDFDASADLSEADADRWQIDAATAELDLSTLQRLLPVEIGPALSGGGDLRLSTEWRQGRLERVRFDAELAAVTVGEPGTDNAPYEKLALGGDWQRADRDGWQLSFEHIDVERNGSSWGGATAASFALERDGDGVRSIGLSSEFVRLADLEPFVRAFPETQLAAQWTSFEPVGDIRDLEFSLARRGDSLDYDLTAALAGVAVNRVGDMPGITGISGRVRAGEDGGHLELATGPARLDWPALFDDVLAIDSLSGSIVWQQARDAVQILGINLAAGVLGRMASGGFDLRLPSDGSSPTLDLRAELPDVDLVPAKDYLPAPIMPPAVVAWLRQAVVGGRAHNVELTFFGPVRSFPFDDGQGQFRVAAEIEDAALDYMTDWPQAEGLDGRIEFVNAGFAASGTGSALTNRASTIEIEIPDMREAVMTLVTDTEGPLSGVVDYLNGAPMIAAHLGPDFRRLEARGGTGAIMARLDLPLLDLSAFALDAALDVTDGTLAIAGLGPEISEINGTIRAREDAVEAEGVDAIFLGGPVTVSVGRSEREGYRAELAFEGETSAEAVAASFALPHDDLLAGQTLWRGRLLLPALDPLATTATRLLIESNLEGVALKFPEPLAKPPGEPTSLRLDLEFAAGNRLLVNGNLGASRRFALSFESGDTGLEFRRGAIRFGGDEPTLPMQSGILVNGKIETLALDAWLELAGSSGLGRAGPSFLGTDIEVADLQAYGQRLGATALRVQRGRNSWDITVDSEPIAGKIVVPRGTQSRDPIVADMRRLYLAATAGGGFAATDPRSLPGLELEADEFAIGPRQFGRASASVAADRRGLVLTRFESETDNYRASISGNWFQGPLRMRTTIDAELESTDVEAALTELGIDPAISGESADVKASVFWDGAPGGDWLDHLNGDVSLFVDTGTLREINPGAGRMLGLMSIAALPRRLTLDFRDVFEDGFAFDEIGGDFRLIDGNAYTNDLKFTGPAAEIGVVGRTGLRDRDYTQQVVVSPEPGNMLPTVAGLLAGPGAGAALFVFTRLFKEPLKGIGQASYCLEGGWEAPMIEPIGNDEPERARQCADIPEAMRDAVVDD